MQCVKTNNIILPFPREIPHEKMSYLLGICYHEYASLLKGLDKTTESEFCYKQYSTIREAYFKENALAAQQMNDFLMKKKQKEEEQKKMYNEELNTHQKRKVQKNTLFLSDNEDHDQDNSVEESKIQSPQLESRFEQNLDLSIQNPEKQKMKLLFYSIIEINKVPLKIAYYKFPAANCLKLLVYNVEHKFKRHLILDYAYVLKYASQQGFSFADEDKKQALFRELSQKVFLEGEDINMHDFQCYKTFGEYALSAHEKQHY